MFSGYSVMAIHGNVHDTVKLIKVLLVCCWLVQGVCGDSPEKDICSIKDDPLMAILCSSVYLMWGSKVPRSTQEKEIRYGTIISWSTTIQALEEAAKKCTVTFYNKRPPHLQILRIPLRKPFK